MAVRLSRDSSQETSRRFFLSSEDSSVVGTILSPDIFYHVVFLILVASSAILQRHTECAYYIYSSIGNGHRFSTPVSVTT